MSRIYVDAESPNEGAHLRYTMNRIRQMRVYCEPESPNEEACLKGLKIHDDPDSPLFKACKVA